MEFEPLYSPGEQEEFKIWELRKPEEEKPVEEEINPEVELAAERERLREEARQKGYQEGLSRAEKEMEGLRQTFYDWFEYIQKPVKLLDKAICDELMKTIVWVCETCINVEISLHPEKILTIFEQLKEILPTISGKKELSLNPDDLEWLKQHVPEKEFDRISLHLSVNPGLKRGDFTLQSQDNDLDGRLVTRLQKIVISQYQVNMDTPEDER